MADEELIKITKSTIKNTNPKRKDQKVYVPPALRKRLLNVETAMNNESNILEINTDKKIKEVHKNVEKETKSVNKPTNNNITIQDKNKNDKSINGKSNKSDKKMNVPEEKDTVESWEDLVDSQPKLIDENEMNKLTDKVGRLRVRQKNNDIDDEYLDKNNIKQTLTNVVELCDFPDSFVTSDLVSIVDSYSSTRYNIRWVDKTHALVVFNSGFAADLFLRNLKHPMIRVRSIAEASKQGQAKALRVPDDSVGERPQTCPQAARRLVTNALGIKMPNNKKEREEERRLMNEERARRRLQKEQRDAAWEGHPFSLPKPTSH